MKLKYNREELEKKLLEENKQRSDPELLKKFLSNLLDHVFIVFNNRGLQLINGLVELVYWLKDSEIETDSRLQVNTLHNLRRSRFPQAEEILSSARVLARVLKKDSIIFQDILKDQSQEMLASYKDTMAEILIYVLAYVQKPGHINSIFFIHNNSSDIKDYQNLKVKYDKNFSSNENK